MKAHGAVGLYSGKDARTFSAYATETSAANFGYALVSISDLNFDEHPDFLVGATF